MERDTPEQLHAAEAATSSERMLRLVMDNIPQGVFWKDRESRYLGCNEVVARVWGLASPEAIVGLTDYELAGLTREQADYFIACDRAVMDQNQAEYGIIEEATLADGSTVWLETNKIPLLDESGTVTGVLGTWQDITARRQTETKLRRSEEQLRIFIEHSPVALAMFDRDMRYLHVSRRWKTDFNTGDRNLRGVSHYEDFPEIPERWKEIHRRGLAGEVLRAEEDQFLRLDGAVQWLRWEVRPWFEESGSVGGIVIFCEEITERKLAAALVAGQNQVLENIAAGKPLSESLEALMHLLEAQMPGSLCSVLVLDPDGKHLRHGAAPSLPAEYCVAIDGVAIGPEVGSCGTAAFLDQTVIVADIASDPLWANYKSLALEHGLQACWSTPIHDEKQQVIGTFAIYMREPAQPTADHARLAAVARQTASIAIVRHRAEAALREREALLSSATDNAAVGLVMLDRDRRYTFASAAYTRMLGLSWEADELIGRSAAEILGEVYPTQVAPRLERAFAGERVEYELTRPRSDAGQGETAHYAVAYDPIRDDEGVVDGVIATVFDITARKRAEQELANEQAISRSFIESLPGLFLWLDDAGRFIHWNENVETVTGYSEDEVARMVALDFFHDEDKELVYQRIQDVFVHGSAELETQLATKDGRRIPYFYKGVRMMLQDRPYLVGVGVDVTELKQAQEALRESEERYRLLAENAEDMIVLRETGGRTLYRSPSSTRILGWTDDDEYAVDWEKAVHPDDAEALKQAVATVEGGVGATFRFRSLTRSGEYVWLEVRSTPIFDADGQTRRRLLVSRDITDRKRAEEERIKLEAQMQHSQKLESLGVLAGGIAHDFNNLLTSILGHSELAKLASTPGSTVERHIDESLKGTLRAAELTQQMLAYSGKGQFVIQPLSFAAVVEDMGRLLEVSISRKCTLQYRFAPDLPNCEADATQMRQVIMNLIINASEAIGDHDGVIAISTGEMHCDRDYLSETYLDEQLPEGHYVYLEVSDSGCGMSEETKSKLFDPFFTTKFTGRGLGLAAVLGIVRGHQGAIKVDSEVGKGTRFRVLIPVGTEPAQAEPAKSDDASEWSGSGCVLLVDDEESVREMLSAAMDLMGFTVLTASDGREGVEVFRRECDRIQLVILDMTMPHLDGEQTFLEMRRIRPGVPTILCSGYDEQTVAGDFVEQGLASFIQKPCPYQQLKDVVRRAMTAGSDPSPSQQ
jgi:two-component system cell cycle sensor histidine kinase/response regulator CckA